MSFHESVQNSIMGQKSVVAFDDFFKSYRIFKINKIFGLKHPRMGPKVAGQHVNVWTPISFFVLLKSFGE